MRARRPPDWLIAERRNALGHWAAFCLACGHTLRYFEQHEDDLPIECAHCGGKIRQRCPTCGGRFASAFAVDCDVCGARLRASDLNGVPIRKDDR